MSQKKSLKRKHAEEETYKKQQKLIQHEPIWEVGEKIHCDWKAKGVFHMAEISGLIQFLDEPVYVVHYPVRIPNHDEEVLQCEAFERFMPATEAYVQKAKAIYDKVKKETAEKKRGKRRSCRPKGVINKT
uniref:Uncharacterized protein n=1 Tax=Ditylenchus dipsaci TaxID=166011 RepID=A0A915ERP9_9BILA